MFVAAIRGITLAYDSVGSGRDVALLIHGHPFNRSMWTPQVPVAVQHGWRVLAPDLRGYGDSAVVAGKVTLDVFAEDLVALLDYLDVRRAVVIGLSMGGQIAMELARTHPSRLAGVLLAATFPRPDTDAIRQERLRTADRIESEGMDAYASELLPRLVASSTLATRPEVCEHVRAMMVSSDPRGAAAALRGRAERPAYQETLARLKVPALVVVGDEDAYTTAADVAEMASLLKAAQIVRMPGVGHLPNLEASGEFNAAFARFLTTLRTERVDRQ
jgi:pimeloyl-ACP methyl ester carboxylesterase